MALQKDAAELFEADRRRMQAIAYRMLGSASEAEDAVQETWLRLARADSIDNLSGWLTTVIARVCLDVLRARKTRGEEPIGPEAEAIAEKSDRPRDSELADSVGVAMLVVLETLAPAERLAFVLHDMFAVPFEEIAPIVERSPAAARQLASRARRRVQGASTDASMEADRERRREVVNAFVAASRDGDFAGLLAVLDPNVILRADKAAVEASLARVAMGAPQLAPEVHGAAAVADVFKGRAAAAKPALVDGFPGLVYAPSGKPFSVFDFVIENGRVIEISLMVDQATIAGIDVEIERRP